MESEREGRNLIDEVGKNDLDRYALSLLLRSILGGVARLKVDFNKLTRFDLKIVLERDLPI